MALLYPKTIKSKAVTNLNSKVKLILRNSHFETNVTHHQYGIELIDTTYIRGIAEEG